MIARLGRVWSVFASTFSLGDIIFQKLKENVSFDNLWWKLAPDWASTLSMYFHLWFLSVPFFVPISLFAEVHFLVVSSFAIV